MTNNEHTGINLIFFFITHKVIFIYILIKIQTMQLITNLILKQSI